MGTLAEQDKALAAAIKAERESGDKHFVYLPERHYEVPGLRAALEKEAAASGRMLVQAMRASNLDQVRSQNQPERYIDKGNHRAVLDNLDGIAAGRVGVK